MIHIDQPGQKKHDPVPCPETGERRPYQKPAIRVKKKPEWTRSEAKAVEQIDSMSGK